MTDAIGTIQRIQSTFDQLASPTSAGSTSAGSLDAFAKIVAAMRATPATTAAAGKTGADIVASAKTYEGIPYVFGGTSRDGIDCTGLVQQALGDIGIKVGRSMDEQMTAGTAVGSLAEAKPGDLIVLDGGAHIVIYSGNGNVIHAPYEGRTVTEQKAWFDDSDIVTIRRVAPQTTAPVVATSSADSLQSLINAQALLFSRGTA